MIENEQNHSGQGTQDGKNKSPSKTEKELNQKSQPSKNSELPQKTSLPSIRELINSKTGVWSSFGHFF